MAAALAPTPSADAPSVAAPTSDAEKMADMHKRALERMHRSYCLADKADVCQGADMSLASDTAGRPDAFKECGCCSSGLADLLCERVLVPLSGASWPGRASWDKLL